MAQMEFNSNSWEIVGHFEKWDNHHLEAAWVYLPQHPKYDHYLLPGREIWAVLSGQERGILKMVPVTNTPYMSAPCDTVRDQGTSEQATGHPSRSCNSAEEMCLFLFVLYSICV